MKLFLVTLNVLLVALNAGLAGLKFGQGDLNSAYLNLFLVVLWFVVTMLNVVSLQSEARAKG